MSLSIKRTLSIIGIISGCIVIALVFTMINTAVPVIQKSLGLSMSTMQWMMTVFGVINCATLVSCGRLADIYGRKKIFVIGLLCSFIAMLFGGFCTGGIGLIVCMSFAGLGNAILLPVSQAMLVSEFPEDQKSRAIGLWAASIATAMSLGPVLGGLIAGAFGWEWVFWVNVPVILASIYFVLRFSKESKNGEDLPLVDYKGMFYLAMTISSFVLLMTEFRSLPQFVSGFLLLVTIAGSSLLWKHERFFPSPLLLKELISNRIFISASLASACLIFYVWSYFFLLPQYLQNIRGLSSVMSGVFMLGITLPMAVISPLIGKYYRSHTAWGYILAGFLLLIASTSLQMLFNENSSFSLIILSTVLFGIGNSLISAPTVTAALSTVSFEKAGVASGSFVTIQEIGGTFGLAIIVSYVRYFPDLLSGFQQGMQALLCVGVIGCLCVIPLMRSAPTFRDRRV
ncbi:MFS transporter [Chlamydiales bacterium]|nr:MFS transporter [Chlamydiales bacterium]